MTRHPRRPPGRRGQKLRVTQERLAPWDDNEKMAEWLSGKLDAEPEPARQVIEVIRGLEEDEGDGGGDESITRIMEILEFASAEAIDSAERGDIKPLQEMYPRLARFLRLPRRKRGQRFTKSVLHQWIEAGRQDEALRRAVHDVPHITRLWKSRYGRRNRSAAKGLWSAEEFAARRHGVNVRFVEYWVKRLKKTLEKVHEIPI